MWIAKICRLFSVLFFALVFQQGTDELRAAGNVIFGKDAAHMGLDGTLADKQRLRDLTVCFSAEKQPKHFVFAAGQRVKGFRLTDDGGALLFAHAVIRGKVGVAFEQQGKTAVERGQQRQRDADDDQSDDRHLRAGKAYGGNADANEITAEHAEHVCGKPDPKHLSGVIDILEHLSEDATPKQIEDSACAQHQRIDGEVIDSASFQQHKAYKRAHHHRHADVQENRAADPAGKAAHDRQRYDIGHGPIPACQPRQVLKGGIDHLIHQTGIDGDDGDEQKQDDERSSNIAGNPISGFCGLSLNIRHGQTPNECHSDEQANHRTDKTDAGRGLQRHDIDRDHNKIRINQHSAQVFMRFFWRKRPEIISQAATAQPLTKPAAIRRPAKAYGRKKNGPPANWPPCQRA